MATFVPIPYTYVPTASRSKSVTAHRKPASNQFNTLDELQRNNSRNTTLNSPRLPAPTTVDIGTSCEFAMQGETNTFHDNSVDDELPTMEEILYPTLSREGFAAADPSPGNAVLRAEEGASQRGGSIDCEWVASGHILESLDNPIDLTRDDGLSDSEAELDGGSLRALATLETGFDSPKTSIDSISSTPPRSDGWYDIEDFPETASRLQLAQHGASTPNPIRPCSSASHLMSEPLHERIGIKSGDMMESYSAHPRSSSSHFFGESQENALGQADHARTSRNKAGQHALISSVDTDALDEGGRQEVEQEDQGNHENDKGQFQVNDVAVVEMAKVSDPSLDTGSRLAQRPRLRLPNDPLASHDETLSRRDGDNDSSDGEPGNRLDSDQENRIPARRKRKQPYSLSESLAHKKRKFVFQQRFTRRIKPHSKLYRRSLKSHSPHDQSSKVALSSAAGRVPWVVPSPTPPAPLTMTSKTSPNHNDLSEPPENNLPTLMEITFRPQSPHCCFFTALVQDAGDKRGVSFAQLARLVESTGHVGKIDDFTIKPREHESFLVTGFSQHASSRPSSSRAIMSIVTKTSPIHEDTRVSDNENGLSESDPHLSGDAGSSSEDEQVPSGPRQHSPWSDLDEQRLIAYKKEGKPWEWIFRKFPGRTQAAIRTRWSMVRLRND